MTKAGRIILRKAWPYFNKSDLIIQTQGQQALTLALQCREKCRGYRVMLLWLLLEGMWAAGREEQKGKVWVFFPTPPYLSIYHKEHVV